MLYGHNTRCGNDLDEASSSAQIVASVRRSPMCICLSVCLSVCLLMCLYKWVCSVNAKNKSSSVSYKKPARSAPAIPSLFEPNLPPSISKRSIVQVVSVVTTLAIVCLPSLVIVFFSLDTTI